jgi:hypothetical protein
MGYLIIKKHNELSKVAQLPKITKSGHSGFIHCYLGYLEQYDPFFFFLFDSLVFL